MAKAVLISIRPEWVEKIARGEKTVEVRKTQPKLEAPFKCYIYCTKASVKYQTICGCHALNSDELYRHPEQGIKHGSSIELMLCENYTKNNFLNGKVVGEFVCDVIAKVNGAALLDVPEFVFVKSCLWFYQLDNYLNGKEGYAWHISNLKIYDAPKPLSAFKGLCKIEADCWCCPYYNYTTVECDGRTIKRPPQSWCYVEDLKDGES